MAAPTQLLTGFTKVARTTKPDPKRKLTIKDDETRGLFVRINPGGARSWLVMARTPAGKQVWATIGDAMKMEASEARRIGHETVQRIKDGLPAVPEPEPEPEPLVTFKGVAEDFLVRHARAEGLRSVGEIERQLKVYLYPAWQDEPFVSVRRGRVVELLNKVNDENGKVMADRVLATVRKLFNWYEVNGPDEEYKSPVVRGMRKTSAKARARDRKLSDDEIRSLWSDWSASGTFGAFLQVCLLTAQRRAKVLGMRWEDISDKGIWTIPAEAREKVNAGALKLPQMALDVISSRPKVEGNPYVFGGRGAVPIGNIGNDKRKMDERVSTEKPWTIHDLRRTAKSLMSRAGVRPDISERTLGHVIGGVEGVYDHHDYATEKAAALEALAKLVALILMPPSDNVVKLEKAGAA